MQFRESQRRIIEEYAGGMMGISAVPGSGKTFTLSHLAARLVEKVLSKGKDGQEVLVVTFSNSAVNSFKKRIADILRHERKLLPYVGYRVRTLHGLAHDIVRERPALVGLADDFQIVDERVAAAILQDVVRAHLPAWGHLIDTYISPDLSEKQARSVRERDFPILLIDVAQRFIKHAKDLQLPPVPLMEQIKEKKDYMLLQFATAVYMDYQRTLSFRGAVDFDDLVALALEAFELDPQYLARWQARFPYVLEDEAQDSSLLQEKMLRLLTAEQNWVRVGDPNQAINTTFTTADPRYLREFLDQPGVAKRDLPVSGRCSPKIIEMANELVRWTVEEHPAKPLRKAFYSQYIQPTTPDDPQQNPADSVLYIHYKPGMRITPDDEIRLIIGSVQKWLPDNPDKTVALLVPENSRGFKLAEALKAAGIPYEELLRSTTSTRQTAAYIYAILSYLAAPHDAGELARLYRDMWQPLFSDTPDGVYDFIRGARQIEDLVWASVDDLAVHIGEIEDPAIFERFLAFLDFVRFALSALSLPIDQLVLAVSQRIFADDPVDMALAYKFAGVLRYFSTQNAAWRLENFLGELKVVMENERKFIGFEDAAEGYSPKPGVVTVATMHAAKGLEWDRVYLVACSNYAFPSLQPIDKYISEKWFLASPLSLVDETFAQLDGAYREGDITNKARVAFCEERLRLLYVGVTRARSDLLFSWNVGRFADRDGDNVLSLPLFYLLSFSG